MQLLEEHYQVLLVDLSTKELDVSYRGQPTGEERASAVSTWAFVKRRMWMWVSQTSKRAALVRHPRSKDGVAD